VQERLARAICIIIGLFALGVVWLRCHDTIRACAWSFFILLVVSPTVHPWYLLWSLALLPIARLRCIWVSSLTISLGYWVWSFPLAAGVEHWRLTLPLMLSAWLPVAVAFAFDLLRPDSPDDVRDDATGCKGVS
ncbi:MAG: hypothetical protein ACR2GY_07375, partial [Phycisphaerales bacterium]